ncbi:hypothetical protein EHQ53_10595 [Leptospira langatensis]|uniref:Uncharacterized protein n=1 Tax=Leptospira langatensis TaxID=2484983 RepID=A0A5F1ZRN4_9LEPT|nr:hypothetical protein [Leptospira langatensis]TGJ98990.1 hypothetical protein EHO57_15905 [Leptospira langatensis]TGL40442.1 hypothetical protein EHQ53_10595 [Leptospira langatensis]
MFLLGQDSGEPILIWPEFSWNSVINGTIFLVAVLLTAYLVQRYIRRKNSLSKEYKNRILTKLQLHKFHSKDIPLFHSFLDQVSDTDLRRLAEDPAWYRRYFLPEFLQFLADQSNRPAWKDILTIHSLDHLIEDHKGHPKNFITAILKTDSEEIFPALIKSQELDANSLHKELKAVIYTKKGNSPLSLSRYGKIQVLIPNESKRWFRSEAILISQEGNSLNLQIQTSPELDPKIDEDWTDTVKANSIWKDPAVPEEYKNSLLQILEYSGLNASHQGEIVRLVGIFKEHPGLLRRQHKEEDYKILIHLYKACFIKFRAHKASVPKSVLLFLYYFFLDEELFPAKRIKELENAISNFQSSISDLQYSEAKFSIHFFPDWLNLILAGKKKPSKNQLGQSYEQAKKSELRWNQTLEEENLQNKEYLSHILDWELENLLSHGLASISLSPNLSYPISSEDQFYGLTEDNLAFPNHILTQSEKVLKIDPSLFQRQLNDIHSPSRDLETFSKREMYADCILLPYAGNRGILWQDSVEENQSYCRILFPMILGEKLNLIVTKVLGEFRWETERTLRGNKWKEPTPASITSEYFDYIENFRRNPHLTVEAKKRVEQQWEKTGKNIKDMFSIDYANWILMEAEGKPRLNRIAREILSRFVPIQIKPTP